MRRLDRERIPPPPCLARLTGGKDRWRDAKPCRASIRRALEAMQGRRCAFCEGHLDQRGQHIEHLWPRHSHPQHTFDWDNLFWSCDQSDSCGHHKGNHAGRFDPAVLIDPTQDDPDAFLRIRRNGAIEPRPKLAEHARYRAAETVRVFNLNLDRPGHRSLCARRRRVLRQYMAREPDLLEALEAFDPAERAEYIRAEIAATADEPFGSIIRHLFLDGL